MTEGARRLSLAQSPLSPQIRQLEQRLGVTLLGRSRGRAAQLRCGRPRRGAAGACDSAPCRAWRRTSPTPPGLREPLPTGLATFREAGAERLVAEPVGGEVDMVLVRPPNPSGRRRGAGARR